MAELKHTEESSVTDIREKLVELMGEVGVACNNTDCSKCDYFDVEGCVDYFIADHMIANGVTVQEQGYWISVPPYRAIDGNWNKIQECPVCRSVFVSDGNTPYSNHPYCCECGARLLPTPPKGE